MDIEIFDIRYSLVHLSIHHHNDVTCVYVSDHWQLDWFSNKLIQAINKKPPKVLITDPLWGKFADDQWFPLQRPSNAENGYLSWRHYICMHERRSTAFAVVLYTSEFQALRVKLTNSDIIYSMHRNHITKLYIGTIYVRIACLISVKFHRELLWTHWKLVTCMRQWIGYSLFGDRSLPESMHLSNVPKMHFKMWFAKLPPFCLSRHVLTRRLCDVNISDANQIIST